ncbi:MAG: CheR family methyltransferase, partial [Gammaproteobacteria bacterium]
MANPSEIADLLGGLKPKEHGQTASASSTVSAAGQPLDQTIAGLVRVLQEHAGFRATDQQQRKLQHIFRRSRPSEVRDLVARIAGNPFSDELAALVEDLTNHETYFFRDRPQLDVVSAELLPAIIREKIAQGERRIRVWSAACATGEEAYTLAMLLVQALLDAGIAHESAGGEIWVPPEWTLEVLGTDISRQAVRIAREASYQIDGMRSFRQFPVEFLRFFKPPRDAYPVVQRPGELPRYRVVGDAL